MSDSGTVQEEAVIYNVPCVILRNETEWTEFVEKGKNILATTDPDKIIPIAKEFKYVLGILGIRNKPSFKLFCFNLQQK